MIVFVLWSNVYFGVNSNPFSLMLVVSITSCTPSSLPLAFVIVNGVLIHTNNMVVLSDVTAI